MTMYDSAPSSATPQARSYRKGMSVQQSHWRCRRIEGYLILAVKLRIFSYGQCTVAPSSSLIRVNKVVRTDRQCAPENNSQKTCRVAEPWGVHTEAIATATHFGGVPGARETTVGGRRFCATVSDVITAVTFLVPLEASVGVISTVAEIDAIFHGHVRGIDIGGPYESSTSNIIPVHEQ